MRRPYVQYITEESFRKALNDYSRKTSKYVVEVFPTYVELKKNMPRILEAAYDPGYSDVDATVSVYRERRGEWGEWFEHWDLWQGKPKIKNSGWQ
jgi:hypothetical protein